MEIYRTFVAIPVKVSESFLRDRQELMGKLEEDRISWVDPANYHVTLRFLGETAASKATEIGDILYRRISPPTPSRMEFSGPGIFGPRKKPRVIWVGFADGHRLLNLFSDVNRILKELGIAGPEQPYRPHLTLGRIRRTDDPSRLFLVARDMQNRFRGDVTADRLVYFRSIPGKAGPVYLPLRTVGFQD